TEPCSIPKIYTEIGCKPIYARGQPNCPISFDCDFLSARNDFQCYYKGKAYTVGQQLDADPDNPCAVSCSCVLYDQGALWDCAVLDCPEYDGGLSYGDQNCYYKYSFDSCCARTKCYSSYDKLDQCQFNGTTYLEGQVIEHTTDPCSTCLCQSGFTGQLGKQFCREKQCSIELYNTQVIRDGCTPVYMENGCCPYDFRCPRDSDVVIGGGLVSGHRCKFGRLTFNIGDLLVSRNECELCSCIMPPFISCINVC
ncbi:hypothetical protein L9F63_021134, partial [Diploptera punctata]